MKHGKRLKRRHKEFLSDKGYKHNDYLIIKDTQQSTEFVNIETGKILVFKNEE